MGGGVVALKGELFVRVHITSVHLATECIGRVLAFVVVRAVDFVLIILLGFIVCVCVHVSLDNLKKERHGWLGYAYFIGS